MNQEQVEGHYEELIGRVREVTSQLAGNEGLETQGKAQAEVGDVEDEDKDEH